MSNESSLTAEINEVQTVMNLIVWTHTESECDMLLANVASFSTSSAVNCSGVDDVRESPDAIDLKVKSLFQPALINIGILLNLLI